VLCEALTREREGEKERRREGERERERERDSVLIDSHLVGYCDAIAQEDVIYIQMELCLGTVYDDWRVRGEGEEGGRGGTRGPGGGGGGREGEMRVEGHEEQEACGTPLPEDRLLQVGFSHARARALGLSHVHTDVSARSHMTSND
jgi:hypothetical protein